MHIKSLARQASIILFGVIFPVYVLFQAYQGVSSLKGDVGCRRATNIDHLNGVMRVKN
jgi:hypothetical protein